MTQYRFAAWPAKIWFLLFLVVPLGLIAVVSFLRRGTYGGVVWDLSFENYDKLLTSTLLIIGARTFFLAFNTAFCCVAVGLLCSWAMSAVSMPRRWMMLGLVSLPFLTNSMIRIIGLKFLVGADGPIQKALLVLGLQIDPYAFTANPILVMYGMVAAYLPFAILPLYGAFEKFDFTLIEAAQDLGASSWAQLAHVVIPILRKPLYQSFLLVFIPCFGEFALPDLLGGARTMLLGNLVVELFLKARDWPFGAAVAVLMLLTLALLSLVLKKWIEGEEHVRT